MTEPHRAVFFDRDGVVNLSPGAGYVTQWADFHLSPGIMDALRLCKERGYLTVLVTSQQGVGKGEMSQADLDEIHSQMQSALAMQNAAFDGIFACNLYSAHGVASALDDLRKSGVTVTARFVGFDTSKKLIEDLQAGRIDALVAQDPERMGYLAVETLVKVVKGEAVPAVIDTGAKMVTRDALQNDSAIRTLVGME